jgi:AraC-like DNA-binding protein
VRARSKNWLVHAPGAVDRIEARFSGLAFSPHRHDRYAIGITLGGVQSFDYRGAARHSMPGQVVVLHPDELHDGRAGDGTAFQYRTAYVAPADIQDVLGGRPLPFVDSPVSDDPRLRGPVRALLQDYDQPLSDLAYQDVLYDLATALQAVTGTARPIKIVHREAANRARDYIDARLDQGVSLEGLERATGHDRWQLSRDFRALFGTSPYRYLIARRLDRARRMMLSGSASAAAARPCGFSDQSHFGRAFKKTFGLTPNAWTLAARSARSFYTR